MRLFKGRTAEVIDGLFQILLSGSIVMLSVNQIWKNSISSYFNLNYLLIIVLITGILYIFSEHRKAGYLELGLRALIRQLSGLAESLRLQKSPTEKFIRQKRDVVKYFVKRFISLFRDKEFVKETINSSFQIVLVVFLLMLLIGQVSPHLISDWLNISWFAGVVLILGILSVLFPPENLNEYKTRQEKPTRKDYIYILLLGIAGFAIIKFKTSKLGWLSWIISIIAGILIILLSLLVLEEDGENGEEENEEDENKWNENEN